MAKKVTKSTKAASTSKKAYKPHDSMIIQAGVVFIIVSAIMVCSYAISMYM